MSQCTVIQLDKQGNEFYISKGTRVFSTKSSTCSEAHPASNLKDIARSIYLHFSDWGVNISSKDEVKIIRKYISTEWCLLKLNEILPFSCQNSLFKFPNQKKKIKNFRDRLKILSWKYN